ncbi:LysR family transcriptional regulator [Lysobacter daejeonensis GH1-9]|uniref:LysR family transcriptional regulator n=1 Tax=Lysobacter daejeonensis GH1-9 TaxID=1385517 RepID=A0A0A0F100_9GAMM|nr:LysR family transcriptional regulator [Lysobacter daejeonensis]KGM56250.1 LysR family transcriptional regulator [Lysobacter daejeonensis GH1-9]
MDQIECMRAFVLAVELEGLSAAARRLQVPRAKVSKQIQALESRLGAQLLMRTTRKLHLTSLGADYFESARSVLDALDDAEQRLQEGAMSPRGLVRVNAPMSFGVRVLGPLLPKFHEQYPDIELQLVLADQLVDPVRDGLDVTIRVANLTDSSMAARMIMPAPRVLVASSAFLGRMGAISTPKDLESRPFLNYSYLQGGTTLQLRKDDITQRVVLSGPLCANNGDVLAQAAEAGVGVALLPEFIVREGIEAKRLVHILPDWQAPSISVNALFCSTRELPQRTRVFIDYLVRELDPDIGGRHRQ